MLKLLTTIVLCTCLTWGATKEIVLTESNSAVLGADINPMSLASLAYIIDIKRMLNGSTEPLYVVLYSSGGIIAGCYELSEGLSTLDNVSIVIIEAYSAAALLSQCPGKSRYIHVDGHLMFHKSSVYLNETLSVSELEEVLAMFKPESEKFDDASRARMNITKEQYHERTNGKNWFLTADEAVKVGAADEVVVVKCAKEFVDNSPLVTSLEKTSAGKPVRLCRILDLKKEQKNGTKTKTK